MASLIASSSRVFLHSRLLVSSRLLSTTCLRRSGHNKWSKIKHGKALQDSQKAALHARTSQEIASAVRLGGSPDPELNITLALTLAKAKRLGVPKENIETALRKASGADSKDDMQVVTYEAFGPGQVACMIECVTDNPNRTVQRVKEQVNKHGGRMADVRYLFRAKSIFRLTPVEGESFEHVFWLALEGGAEEVRPILGSDEIEIHAPSSCFHTLNTILAPKTNLSSSEVAWLPFSPPDEDDISDEIKQQLDDLELALQEKADCVQMFRAY